MVTAASGPWCPNTPHDAAIWFSGTSVLWWIAGGWALDLFIGHQSRDHGDLDVGILRRDVLKILQGLHSWEFFEAKEGVLVELPPGRAPHPEVNSLWCRPQGSSAWALQLLLDEADGDRWLFRRSPHISRPLTTLTRRAAELIPYLVPEIQLLYKARTPRPRDQADFARVLPLLDEGARAWLQESLRQLDPLHQWLPILAERSVRRARAAGLVGGNAPG